MKHVLFVIDVAAVQPEAAGSPWSLSAEADAWDSAARFLSLHSRSYSFMR